MPTVLQIALNKIFRCAVGLHFVSNSAEKSHSSRPFQVCNGAIILAHLKRQGLKKQWLYLHYRELWPKFVELAPSAE